jgi:hypothetical protein
MFKGQDGSVFVNVNPPAARPWTRARIAQLSDDAIWALLESDTLTDDEITSAEDELDTRDYDASDPASPQNTAMDARDNTYESRYA